ncbi:unnamed protein product [Urochloa humidicola]
MASPVAQLRCPDPSEEYSDPGLVWALGSEHGVPVDEYEDDEYRKMEDAPVDCETTCPGQNFTKKQEKEISLAWMLRHIRLNAEFSALCNEILSQGDENVTFPPKPLKVLPETTYSCIMRGYCYHREYMTSDTSRTKSTLGFRSPQQMMQVFSLRLSSYSCKSYPISIYGIFAVRDDLEPLRNYVFNRSRDDPVMIHQDFRALPLCSPCRGMYVLDRALLEVDLWVKREGDGSNDEKLLSEYVEINMGSGLDTKFTGRIQSDHCMLDIDYMYLAHSVETTIQIFTVVLSPHPVKFIAFSSCFDNEIVLFEGNCVAEGELFHHVVAVKAKEKLGVRLELENSQFEWTFQIGTVGAFSSPDDASILDQFNVRVFCAPKNGGHRSSRYNAWEERCRNKGSSGLLM